VLYKNTSLQTEKHLTRIVVTCCLFRNSPTQWASPIRHFEDTLSTNC